MAWKTSNNPRTEFVTTRFAKDEAEELDGLAAALGLSRSEAVRSAVKRVARAEAKKTARQS